MGKSIKTGGAGKIHRKGVGMGTINFTVSLSSEQAILLFRINDHKHLQEH